jgi:hypothetical protein
MAAKRRKKRKRPDLINPGFFLRPLRFFAANVRTVLLDSVFEGRAAHPDLPDFPRFDFRSRDGAELALIAATCCAGCCFRSRCSPR